MPHTHSSRSTPCCICCRAPGGLVAPVTRCHSVPAPLLVHEPMKSLDVMLDGQRPASVHTVSIMSTAGFRSYWFTASMSHRYLYLVFCIFWRGKKKSAWLEKKKEIEKKSMQVLHEKSDCFFSQLSILVMHWVWFSLLSCSDSLVFGATHSSHYYKKKICLFIHIP